MDMYKFKSWLFDVPGNKIIAGCALTGDLSFYNRLSGERLDSHELDAVSAETGYLIHLLEEKQCIVSLGLSDQIVLQEPTLPHAIWRLWDNECDGLRHPNNEQYAKQNYFFVDGC